MGRQRMTRATALLAACFAAAATAIATDWDDCGPPNATLHFTNVTSDPDPVHKGEKQTITKTGGYSGPAASLGNFTIDFKQYWQVLGKWVKFLDLKVDACKDHPDMCPLGAGKNFSTTAVHPPLNPMTPYGMYRSLQDYYDPEGRHMGCVDMRIRYEK